MGPWEEIGDPCIGDDDHLTFHSQGTYIFKVESPKEDVYIFMAESTQYIKLFTLFICMASGNL